MAECKCGGVITESRYLPVAPVEGREVVRVTQKCGACSRVRIELRDKHSGEFLKLEAGG